MPGPAPAPARPSATRRLVLDTVGRQGSRAGGQASETVGERSALFYSLSSWALVFGLFGIIFGATAIGLLLGRRFHDRSDTLRDPIVAMQGALLGFMALVLAFGLTLAVGRYENRRQTVVDEANAIGTTYLRAQTLAEPVRSQSLALLERYTDTGIRLTLTVPDTPAARQALADGNEIERQLWALAGQALDAAPVASAPRLYVESLNEMFDSRETRAASLDNRVPTPVLGLEVLGAAVALGLLAFYLGLSQRGLLSVLVASVLVALMLLITFDLDRPRRGWIRVPATPLVALRASMALPPAAAAPSGVP